MKATKTIGSGVNGVNVHFTIGDLVNMNQLVHEIMTNRDSSNLDEPTAAEALALVVHKITSGGLDLEQSSKDMHNKDYDIFKVKKSDDESQYSQEDFFNEVEDDKNEQKEIIGVLMNLEAKAPQLKVVKDEDKEPPMTE